MKTREKFYLYAMFLGIFAISSQAWAASQGTLGLTSQGSATISITKNVQARISNISDMTLSNWNVGDAAVVLHSNVCIYSSTGGYKVTATGDTLGLFTIASGLNTILYTVEWNDGGPSSLSDSGTALLPGVMSLTTFSNANTDSSNCGGSSANDNARVIVKIAQLAMHLAPSSSTPYTGTLTMLVTPF